MVSDIDLFVSGIDLLKSGITLGTYNLISATAVDANSIHTSVGTTLALASAGKLVVDGLDCNVLTYDESIAPELRPELFQTIVINPVLWLTPDGETFATTYWVDGSDIDVSYVSADGFGIDESIESNGWFTFAYSTWERDNAAEGVVYKPVAKKVVQSLTEVYVSLGISNNFKYFIYIPTPDVVGDYEIVFDHEENPATGFFDKNGNSIASAVAKNVTVDGVSGYTRFTGEIPVDVFVADTVIIKYAVNGVILEREVSVDIFKYADKVDAAYGCGTAESQLVYAMLQYKLESYKTAMGDGASSSISKPSLRL